MKKLLLIKLLILGVLSYAWGQYEGEDLSAQIDLKKSSEKYYVAAAGNEGLVLFRPLDSTKIVQESMIKTSFYRFWEFAKFSNEFVRVWTIEAMVAQSMVYNRHYWDGNMLHVLLIREKPRRKRHFHIISLDIKTGMLNENKGIIPENLQINDFSVVKNMAYIGGETVMSKLEGYGRAAAAAMIIPIYFGVLNYNPDLVCSRVDLKKGRTYTLPFDYRGSNRIYGFEPNAQARSMSTIITHSPRKEVNRVYIKEYAQDKLIRNLEINPKSHNRILTARIMHLNRDKFLVVGTYAAAYYRQKFWKRLGAILSGQRLPEMAQGIYVAKFAHRGQKYIKYYNFTEFENFFEAYGPKEEKKVKKKAKKKKKRGKELLLDFDLLLHDIVETEDEYMLVAEVYKPVYRAETTGRDPRTGTARTSGPEQFVGYQYTHAIVAGIDAENGDMKWDNSFPIWNLLTPNLEEQVQVLKNENELHATLVYNYDGILQSRMILEGEVLESRELKALKRDFIKKLRSQEYESNIEYWYDNYFLAWGYQKVKKEEATGFFRSQRQKPIFYFYKVSY